MDECGDTEGVQGPVQGRLDPLRGEGALAAGVGPARGGAGEVEEVGAFGGVEPQCAGDGVRDALGDDRAEFAVSEHSARHLRRILRVYLTGAGLSDVTDAAELALTELVANSYGTCRGATATSATCFSPAGSGWRSPTGARTCPPSRRRGTCWPRADAGCCSWPPPPTGGGGMPHLDGRGKTVWFECLLDAADGPTEKPDRRRS
jgi:hypothetical protein